MSISFLNLDNSYPFADAHHATNFAGVIRFIDATDSNGLQAIQRLQGDLVHRHKLHQDKINEVIQVLLENPNFSSFDPTLFSFTDGRNPFTEPVGGVAPTQPSHLTPKDYVDASNASLAQVVDAVASSLASTASKVPVGHFSEWLEPEWQPNTKVRLQFNLVPSGINPESIVSMGLIERLNTAQATVEDPYPEPVYVYRVIPTSGTKYGYFVDDMWFEPQAKLNVLVANQTLFPSGYPNSAEYTPVTQPSERWLKAFVLTATEAGPPTEATYQTGRIDLTVAETDVAIAFTTPFATPPKRVDFQIIQPDGSAVIPAHAVVGGSITAGGFTVRMSPAPDIAGFEAIWSAYF